MKKQFQLNIRVYITDQNTMGHGTLEIAESVNIEAKDFLELASVLAKFHELAETLQTIKEKP